MRITRVSSVAADFATLISKIPAVVIIAAILCWPLSASAESLRAVTFLPTATAFVAPFVSLVNEVNADGGPVEIDIIGGPEAIPPFELGNAVHSGAIDVALLPVNYYRAIAIEAETLQLIDGTFAELRGTESWSLLDKIHGDAGLKLLGVYGDTVPFYTYLNSPVTTADFNGLRLRVSPVYSAFYKSLGATTVNMPPPEIHSALNAGAVDGFGWPAWDVSTFGWDKFTKFRVEPGFYNTAIAIVVNNKRWNTLSDDQQSFLTENVVAFEQRISKEMSLRTDEELARQVSDGMTVIDLGAGYVASAEEVYWDFLEQESPEHIGTLRALLSGDN